MEIKNSDFEKFNREKIEIGLEEIKNKESKTLSFDEIDNL